jgi:nucleotide-binding universal stress UspA family protein
MSIFPTKILLATDGSKEAQLATTTAVDIANSTDSELHLVVVGPVLPAHFEPTETEPVQVQRETQRLFEEQVERTEAAGGKIAHTHLRFGGTTEEIVNLAEEISAGLIVTGSRGRGGIRRALMGSVSDGVVRHAHCPVLVVREERQ